MEHTRHDSIQGRKIAILLATGFDHEALQMIQSALAGKGATCEVVAQKFGPLRATNGQMLEPDKIHVTTGSVLYDAVLVPAGKESVGTLCEQADAVHFVQETYRHGKPIGAVGQGSMLLERAGLPDLRLAGRAGAGAVVSERGVVSVADPDELMRFVEAFTAAIAQHRHWDRRQKDKVPA